MENNNSTIHIFGYGETQINSVELSVKVKTEQLTTVNDLIDAIWAKKPLTPNTSEKVYHAINIFNKTDIRWQSEDGFDIIADEELTSLVDSLIAELQSFKDSDQNQQEATE